MNESSSRLDQSLPQLCSESFLHYGSQLVDVSDIMILLRHAGGSAYPGGPEEAFDKSVSNGGRGNMGASKVRSHAVKGLCNSWCCCPLL